MNIERRQYKRAIFTIEDGVVGVFLFLNSREKPLSAKILNICMGGMCIAMSVANERIPQKGDHIALLQIKTPPSLKFFLNIDINVKWVLNLPDVEYIGIGCEFIYIPKISREQIGNFIRMASEERFISH
jgi:c-di-GMP-binding flagellar brake protein YcgR